MKWDFSAAYRKWYADLKWHECGWAMLPIALTAIGGGIGGLCGGAALAVNLWIMRKWRSGIGRYLLTGGSTVAAAAAYLVLAKLFLAATGLGGATPESVDRDLKKQPIYAAAAKADPDGYLKLRAALTDAVNHGKAQQEIALLMQGYAAGLTKRALPVASDDAVVGFTRVITLEIDQIGAKSADACYDFLFPRPGAPPIALATYAGPELVKADVESATAVIESAAAHPQRVPERPDIIDALNRVVAQLVAQYGRTDVAALGKPDGLDHAKACAMVNALYKQALALPPSDGAPLLRFLFAQNHSA